MRVTGVCVVIAVCAVGGCFEPQLATNLPCANGLCPEGQDCIDGVCRPEGTPGTDGPGGADAPIGLPDARIDGSPVLDSDGDGFDDSMDNCVSIPNNQHDEDADGDGDECDACPHLSIAAPDGDGDGIGDPCDPRPTNPNDMRDKFFGFDVASTELAAVPAGSWTVGGDVAVFDGTGTARLAVSGIRSRVMIAIGGDIDPPVSDNCEIKAVAGLTASNVYTACTLDDLPPTIEIEDETATGTNILDNAARPDPLDPGPFQLTIIADPTADTVGCSGTEGGDFVSIATPVATALTAGQVAVMSRNAAITVRYLFVVVMN